MVAFVAEAAMFGFGKNRVWFGATKSFPTRVFDRQGLYCITFPTTYNGHIRGYYYWNIFVYRVFLFLVSFNHIYG